MIPTEQGQVVLPAHAWAPSEDHFAKKQLLLQRHSLLDTEHGKFESNFLVYIVFGLAALFAASILVILLTLALLPSPEIPAEPAIATYPPFVVRNQDETKFSPIIIAMPRDATPPARRIFASVATPSAGTAPVSVNHQVKRFTRGKLYYRSAYLDETRGYLFVGAMENLFKLQLDDISLGPVTELHLPAPKESMSGCRLRGGDQLGPDVDCRNHIREVHPIRDGSTLYICGTNSRNPTDWQVQASNLSFVPARLRAFVLEDNRTGKAEGRCSDFISRDTSSLWLDDAPVPGVSSVVSLYQLAQGRHSIYRSAIPIPGTRKIRYPFIKTDDFDGATLSDPHSAGTLSFGAHAYFVFREQASEQLACGVRIVSAIARVCKNDFGGAPGTGRREQLWTSYMKVRLRCTDFVQYPDDTRKEHFTFDAIHASSWVPNLETGVLFGAFTTVTNGYPDSAVCAFRREDIERAFNTTTFIEVSLSRDALSKPVRANTTSYTGKAAACTAYSRTLDPAETNFLLSHPLLAESPKQLYNRAFYTLSAVAFRAMAASVFSEAWGSWVICYVATENGQVLKLAEEIATGSATPSPAERVDAFNVSRKIHKLMVSMKHRSLYVFSDEDVLQYRLDNCEGRPQQCSSCVIDPFCGWDGTRCLPHVDGVTRRTC